MSLERKKAGETFSQPVGNVRVIIEILNETVLPVCRSLEFFWTEIRRNHSTAFNKRFFARGLNDVDFTESVFFSLFALSKLRFVVNFDSVYGTVTNDEGFKCS